MRHACVRFPLVPCPCFAFAPPISVVFYVYTLTTYFVFLLLAFVRPACSGASGSLNRCFYPWLCADVVFGARAPTSSNSFASGANQNSGNCITDRPTTRVHAAPGGKSSFSLGWE